MSCLCSEAFQSILCYSEYSPKSIPWATESGRKRLLPPLRLTTLPPPLRLQPQWPPCMLPRPEVLTHPQMYMTLSFSSFQSLLKGHLFWRFSMFTICQTGSPSHTTCLTTALFSLLQHHFQHFFACCLSPRGFSQCLAHSSSQEIPAEWTASSPPMTPSFVTSALAKQSQLQLWTHQALLASLALLTLFLLFRCLSTPHPCYTASSLG